MFTTESLSFTEISGTGIANRGLLQNDILLGAASYLQQIADRFDNSSQHFEPGVWINVPATTNPAEAATVTRMGSIPHGATINLQGTATHITGGPHFPPVSIVPFRVGSPDDGETGLVHQPEETLATPSVSRTPLTRVAALDQAHLTNPNLFLSDAIAHATIVSTTVLSVTSDTSVAGSVPNVGGGTDNIAFLTGTGTPPTGGPNARVVSVKATFCIEGFEPPNRPVLQYSQRVLLEFGNIVWPHITIGTLGVP